MSVQLCIYCVFHYIAHGKPAYRLSRFVRMDTPPGREPLMELWNTWLKGWGSSKTALEHESGNHANTSSCLHRNMRHHSPSESKCTTIPIHKIGQLEATSEKMGAIRQVLQHASRCSSLWDWGKLLGNSRSKWIDGRAFCTWGWQHSLLTGTAGFWGWTSRWEGNQWSCSLPDAFKKEGGSNGKPKKHYQWNVQKRNHATFILCHDHVYFIVKA